jgi:CBS domain-containing protein
MQAADVMTRDVAVTSPDATVEAAIATMLARHVSGLPVVNAAGEVVGVLSEGDLLRRVELGTEMHRPGWLNLLRGPQRAAEDYVRSHTRHVSDVMSAKPVTADQTAPLEDIVKLMTQKHVKRVPVTSNGRLTGIVCRSDLVRALAGAMTNRPTSPADDAALKEAVVAEIERQPWSNACQMTVEVKGGHARLTGVVFQDGITAALRVAAESVSGVQSAVVEAEYAPPMPLGV